MRPATVGPSQHAPCVESACRHLRLQALQDLGHKLVGVPRIGGRDRAVAVAAHVDVIQDLQLAAATLPSARAQHEGVDRSHCIIFALGSRVLLGQLSWISGWCIDGIGQCWQNSSSLYKVAPTKPARSGQSKQIVETFPHGHAVEAGQDSCWGTPSAEQGASVPFRSCTKAPNDGPMS